jgi:signal transduction histidine kinase
LAEEQAALRRVATLVAREASSHELFAAVADEVLRLLRVENTLIYRFEGDVAVVVAIGGESDPRLQSGLRVMLDGDSVAVRIRRTARPARLDSYDHARGDPAAFARRAGIHSAAGAPIVVEGRLWGALFALSRRTDPLPPDTESRLEQFSQLVATAISNAEARTEVARLVEEQAALRRVAALVAHGEPPATVFEAICTETARVLDAELSWLLRYEPDEQSTLLVARGLAPMPVSDGTRFSLAGENLASEVLRTGRLARRDNWDHATGELGELARQTGVRAGVGVPIVVEGRLWGTLAASWGRDGPVPPGIDDRLAQFAELAGTAISNADSQDQLTASRARVVAAGDEARRRVVRDLHDGAQQRLVHTIVTLKMAQRAMRQNDGRAEALVAEGLAQAQHAIGELRELAQGLLPSVLTRGGLRAGVEALLSRIDLLVTVDVVPERFPPVIEASAYFVVAEALTNVAKHSQAQHAEVRAWVRDGVLEIEVRDDGVGGARSDGRGLVGLDDRIEAVGGRFQLKSPSGGGTLVSVSLPLPL